MRILGLIVALLMLGCGRQPAPDDQTVAPGWHVGTWVPDATRLDRAARARGLDAPARGVLKRLVLGLGDTLRLELAPPTVRYHDRGCMTPGRVTAEGNGWVELRLEDGRKLGLVLGDEGVTMEHGGHALPVRLLSSQTTP